MYSFYINKNLLDNVEHKRSCGKQNERPLGPIFIQS